MIGIYKITSPTGKIYIGQSKHIEIRFRQYKNINQSKNQHRLHRSFVKYGVENHLFEIIYECDFSELNKMERYFQDVYFKLSNKKSLNCVLTDSGIQKKEVSKETREKMSKANKGKKLSQEQRDFLVRINTGVKWSEERKIQYRLKKPPTSNETKLKQSISAKKRAEKGVSEETRRKISEKGKNRIVSEATRKKISIGNKGNEPVYKGKNMPLDIKLRMLERRGLKKVINTETNEVFPSIKAAAESMRMPHTTLISMLNGKNENKTTMIYLNY